jgi:hypothetical protein
MIKMNEKKIKNWSDGKLSSQYKITQSILFLRSAWKDDWFKKLKSDVYTELISWYDNIHLWKCLDFSL